MDILDRMPFKAQKKVFEKLLSVASIENMTPEERAQYDLVETAYRDNMNAYNSAIRRGKAEGLAEGEAKGKAEGKAEGIRLVAKSLKQNGMDIALIMQTTGLSETEINTL